MAKKEQKTKGKEPNEIVEILNGINADNANEALEFVLSDKCREIRLQLLDNSTGRSYQRINRLIRVVIEMLHQNGSSFDIMLNDESTLHVPSGDFSWNIQGIRIENDHTVYFGNILGITSIADGENIYYVNEDSVADLLDGSATIKEISRYRPQSLL